MRQVVDQFPQRFLPERLHLHNRSWIHYSVGGKQIYLAENNFQDCMDQMLLGRNMLRRPVTASQRDFGLRRYTIADDVDIRAMKQNNNYFYLNRAHVIRFSRDILDGNV